MRWVGPVAMLILVTFVAACTSTPDQSEPAVAPQPGPLPAYAEIAVAQNQRAAMLDRVWAATTAIVTYEDQDGQVRTEQAEGYLQIIQPTGVALSLGKQITSEVYFYLGCNAERYWWLDRLDAERKVAYVGTHAMATPERAAQFGAPVHPLDLLDLLGITALPDAVDAKADRANGEDGQAVSSTPSIKGMDGWRDITIPDGVRLSWSPDGESVVVDVPGRFGTRRTWFEPESLMPRRVEILDDRGRVVVYSTLTGDVVVEVEEDSRQRPLMSASAEVLIPGTEISIRLRMDRLANRGSRQREAPFDLDGLLRAYPVDRVEDLDLIEIEEAVPTGPASDGPARVPDRRLRARDAGRASQP